MDDLSGIGLTNFIFFMSISVLFLIICKGLPGGNNLLIGLFFATTFFAQLGLNAATTANTLICGKLYIGTAIVYTIIPWLLILGVGNLFILYFPGWIRVFANTFGIWLSYKISPNPVIDDVSHSSSNPQYDKLYNEILNHPQTIINEINILDKKEDEILSLITGYKGINPEIFTDKHDNNKKIVAIIKYKNKLGILIWNILFGLIASMISTNSLLNSGCSINLI